MPSCFILKLKRDEEGNPARHKARLAARDKLQPRHGTSLTDLYAAVIPSDLVLLLVIVSAAFNWSMEQLDTKRAYLYSDLFLNSTIWVTLL